jgi:hypothetical protein
MNQERLKENSLEEAYFYKLNKELIERKRKELDSKLLAETVVHSNNPNWMKCPKCGDCMEEMELMRIKVDKCVQCQGIYFDNGELQILLESQEPKGFLGKLRKVF